VCKTFGGNANAYEQMYRRIRRRYRCSWAACIVDDTRRMGWEGSTRLVVRIGRKMLGFVVLGAMVGQPESSTQRSPLGIDL